MDQSEQSKPSTNWRSSAWKRKRPVATTAVHCRSKTVLILVDRLEDVAPAAALCSLVGDMYRHRTLFQSKEPILVLRVAVSPSLRLFFTASVSGSSSTSILTWRAHEASSSSSRWKTHVGAPDSIWCLKKSLEEAFYGRSSSLQGNLSHDDGGMADMIVVPTISSFSLTLWQRLARLVNSLPPTQQETVPPLVIATLGNVRGLDWTSRIAFSLEQNKISKDVKNAEHRRAIALVGFPNTLWHCRLVPHSQVTTSSKKIITPYTKPSAVVLMIGCDSTSTGTQSVMMQLSSPVVAVDEVLLLLRQTIFPPATILDPSPFVEYYKNQELQTFLSSKTQLYSLLWSLLQDPHIVQFPCYMATQISNNSIKQSTGRLILLVFQELLQLIRVISLQDGYKNYNNKSSNMTFLHVLTDPALLSKNHSLLAKLLGFGGAIVEDITNNRMPELLHRLYHQEPNARKDSVVDQRLIHQPWMLEPLLNRTANAEWHQVMVHSPFSTNLTTTMYSGSSVLQRQIQSDTIEYGLSLVLQLSKIYNVDMPTVQRVVQNILSTADFRGDGFCSASPVLPSWCIQTPTDLDCFLMENPLQGSDLSRRGKGIRRYRTINVPLSRL